MIFDDVTYRLAPNNQVACPTQILYFDCETRFDPDKTDQIHTFRLAVSAYQRYRAGKPIRSTQWQTHYTTQDVWDYIEAKATPKKPVWVAAHNLDFDFAAIAGFKYLEERGWQVQFWAITSNVFLLRLRKGNRSIQFVDTLGYIHASIKSLGKDVDLDKFTMPSVTESDTTWETYCQRDVAVMKRGFERFLSYVVDNDLGSLSFTIAGQALRAYRHRFLRDTIWIHRHPDVMESEQASYHGGRTEAFFIGKVPRKTIYYLDITSMYPSVMRDESFPVRFLGQLDNPSTNEVTQCLRRYEVLVDGNWNVEQPVLPVTTDRLTFPIGKFSTTITGPEFRFLWERGWVDRVNKLLVYQRGHPFAGYVDYFWERRSQAKRNDDKIWDRISKLFLNSLYGKFGQRNPVYKVTNRQPGQPMGVTTVISPINGQSESRLVFGDKVYIKDGTKPARWSFYPLASWVTGYARLRLWELIHTAGQGHVFYCDTDSVFVDQTGYDRLQHLIQPDKLGALDIRQTGTELTIHGAKDYEFDGKRWIKGVPVSAQQNKDGDYVYNSFDKTRTRLRNGTLNQIVQREKTKRLAREYRKGEVQSDGTVVPFTRE